jgi:hypothetical protein
LASLITGSSVTYAGGGSGGVQSGTNPAAPAGGTRGSTSTANNGSPNTGAGAGGGTGSIVGGNGGSGIVVLRYPSNNDMVATGGTISYLGGYTIHTFTATGNHTLVVA